MLQIECPWCGARDEDEFVNGGDANIPRPAGDAPQEGWTEYLFFHDNPKGALAERWHHAYGCRRWFNALRDTASHTVLATWRPDEPMPESKA